MRSLLAKAATRSAASSTSRTPKRARPSASPTSGSCRRAGCRPRFFLRRALRRVRVFVARGCQSGRRGGRSGILLGIMSVQSREKIASAVFAGPYRAQPLRPGLVPGWRALLERGRIEHRRHVRQHGRLHRHRVRGDHRRPAAGKDAEAAAPKAGGSAKRRREGRGDGAAAARAARDGAGRCREAVRLPRRPRCDPRRGQRRAVGKRPRRARRARGSSRTERRRRMPKRL